MKAIKTYQEYTAIAPLDDDRQEYFLARVFHDIDQHFTN